MSLRHLDSLFRPRSIAFIGASQELGRIGTMVTRNLSPDIANCPDVGGVVLDLDTPQAAMEAEQRIRSRLHRLFPEAQVDGFSIQKMVHRPGSQELTASVVSDSVFGPVILFGQGGSERISSVTRLWYCRR